MLSNTLLPPITMPHSVDEALRDLQQGNGAAVPVAGASWVMRATLRHEAPPQSYVSLAAVAGFRDFKLDADSVAIGPLLTHDFLARHLPDDADLRGLSHAAGQSANPGVRRIATIGGNLCAQGFAASDFAPALLSLDARVSIRSAAGPDVLPIEHFMERRSRLENPWLIEAIVLPRSRRFSAHERLPMRRAGDYPCAIVSVSADVSDGGIIHDARIAAGAVEAVARRWRNLEAALDGMALASPPVEAAARDLLADFTGRDAVDAPGWYRKAVLPVLVRRAFDKIEADFVARR